MTDTKENTIDKTQVIKKIHDLFSKDQFSAAVECLKLLGSDFDCADDVILKKTKEFQKEVCDLVNSVAPNTLDGGGWEVICAEKGKDHVYYRREENDTKNDDKVSGKMSFRVEGFVEAPLLNLASLIYELDMWPKWFPGMIKARTHATISKFRLVPVMESWLPWPMANRHLRLFAYGDLYNNDSVAIYARDLRKFDLVGEDHLKIEFPITPDGTVALTLYFAGFHIIPCSENVSFLKCIFCLDPHLDALPMSLLNFMVSKTAGVLLNLIREQVKPEKVKGSEYEKRMNEKSVYDEMRKRMKEMEFGESMNRYLTKQQIEAYKKKMEEKKKKRSTSKGGGGGWLW